MSIAIGWQFLKVMNKLLEWPFFGTPLSKAYYRFKAACAAANFAMGTRKAAQLT
jgi:hypothetical protein